ncbi:Ribokinase-like protein [Irpex rosettiformis]|uniref:Ribokinase-like protein n=1 Tax=Irpex rosettiformis TaxID=378272 RepID=A0ACB8UB25_9APHY|nr:Ribokinase-like protein [Irpex rosettiformis]
MSKGRVLSIQSHVAFGYVGGKAAVFPLQCLGYDVDVVNTVNFSNHSGYRRFGGTRANAAELSAIFQYMEGNGLLHPERLLTGYIPGGDALSAVTDLARKLREHNPELIYLLDPVLGDSGKLYVSADVIPIYRSILPLSTIITPNWFEVEVLTDVQLTDLPSLRRALKVLHTEYRVPNVVISSIPLREWLKDSLPSDLRPPVGEDISDSDYLLSIVSSTHGNTTENAPSIVHARSVTCLPGYFSGVGDLFSALVLGHYEHSKRASPEDNSITAIADAVAQALTKTHAMLSMTHMHAANLPEDERQPTDEELDSKEPDRVVRRMRGRELRLIQGQDIIRNVERVEEHMGLWDSFWTESQ